MALTRYVAAWVAGAALVTLAAVALLGWGDRDTVELPAIRQLELTSAARAAGCALRSGDRGPEVGLPPDSPRLRRPARPGIYEQSPGPARLGAALRRGVVVLQYRRLIPGERVEELRAVQRALPVGTVLTPERVRTPYEVSVLGYRRLLACPRFTDATVDAIQLFRGRFVGSRPRRGG